MSRSLGIHYSDDGESVALPPDTPERIRIAYGNTTIMDFWSEFQELAAQLGVAPIHELCCDLDLYLECVGLEEEIEEAEAEGDTETAQELRSKGKISLPSFSPDQVRATFSAFQSYIEANSDEVRAWKGADGYADLVRFLLDELEGFELALKEAEKAERSVFVLGS